MKIGYILPMSMMLGLIVFSLVAKWYWMPKLLSQSFENALRPLLLLHSTRFIGMAFLIPGVTAEILDPRFANPAAYGDLLAALLALLALLALSLRWKIAVSLVWIFNTVGMIDLLNAVFQGIRFVPGGHMGATYFIPAVIVPALLVTHVMVFIILGKRYRTR